MFLGNGLPDAIYLELWDIMFYTSRSLLRMFAAIVISYAFGIFYGVAAARSRRGELILMPILDILQSVPILGFFPAAIFFFAAVFQESWIGIELAAVFLIFTSQAWNIAFAVYESVSAIPLDLEEAASSLHLKGLAKLRCLILPACIPKMVYNGMMSWAGGWYFLVAAEMITLGSRTYSLPGIGRYLAEATYSGNYQETIWGLASLILTILTIDLLFWRPLRGYAELFRYESVSAEQMTHHTLFHASRFAWLKSRLVPTALMGRVAHLSSLSTSLEPVAGSMRHVARKPGELLAKHSKLIICILTSVIVVATLASTVPQILRHTPSLQALYEELFQSQDVASEIGLIPAALGSSIARLFIAYLLSIAWTLPLAVRIAGSRKTFGAAVFAMQVLASIPATAVFPIIILATMKLPGGLQLTSIILTMTGMQWYLLFNLLGGVRSIPSDLLEASQTYRLKGFEKWRKLVIPAILPSFITGSITAWGGGWNALVVSEYIVFGRETVAVLGIGALLDKAAYNLGSVGLLFVNIAVMVVTIMTINRLLWRRSYHLVLSKYRMDY